MKSRMVLLTVSLLVLLAAAVGAASATTYTLSGTAVYVSGGGVPGATITISDTVSTWATTTTDSEGRYNLVINDTIPAKTYTISGIKSGYSCQDVSFRYPNDLYSWGYQNKLVFTPTGTDSNGNLLASADWSHYNGDTKMSGAAGLITSDKYYSAFKYFNVTDGTFLTYKDATKHTPLFIENDMNMMYPINGFLQHMNSSFYPSAGVGDLQGYIYTSDGKKYPFSLHESNFLGLMLTNTITLNNSSYTWRDYLPTIGSLLPFVGAHPGNVYIDIMKGTTANNAGDNYLTIATDPLCGTLKDEWDLVGLYNNRWLPMLGERWAGGQTEVTDYRQFQIGGVMMPINKSAYITGYEFTQQSTTNTVHGYIFYPVDLDTLSAGMSLVGTQENLFSIFMKLMGDFGTALTFMVFLFGLFYWFFIDPTHWIILLVFYECFAMVLSVRNCGNFFTMVTRFVRYQVTLFTFSIQMVSLMMSVAFYVMQALEPMINLITGIFGSTLNLLIGGFTSIFGATGTALTGGVEAMGTKVNPIAAALGRARSILPGAGQNTWDTVGPGKLG